MPGYSGTPLAKKLGIKPGYTVFAQQSPRDYLSLIAPVPEGVTLVQAMSKAVDIAHIFSESRASLAAILPKILAKLKPDASIWVSWPKKTSKVVTDITDNVIREIALPMGLVDIKVCAVTDVWSGLKLVIRVANRGAR